MSDVPWYSFKDMDSAIRQLARSEFPPLLREIPDSPPLLYLRGNLPKPDTKTLAIVGSRKYTNYGKEVCEMLVSGLRGYNICIVSGLAIGIDGVAHQSALDAGLMTVAIPGSGLHDKALYPRRHQALAHEILAHGGGLLSEYEPDFDATTWSFPRRNRIMAGMSHAVLVIEASEQSGTLITSRLATDYNRDVLTVPGSIFSENTRGPHMLIKLGAAPVTKAEDVLEALRIDTTQATAAVTTASLTHLSAEAHSLLRELSEPKDRDTLIRALAMDAQQANILLMQLEMQGFITEDAGVFRKN